jgi:flagellar FliL protein
MAKDKEKDKGAGDAGGKKSSLISVIVSVALITLIAGGGGFAFGTLLLGPKPPEVAAHAAAGEGHEGASEEKPAAEGEHASAPEPGRIVRQLAPIVTNLQSPKDSWIRIELSLVLKPEAASEQDIIAVQAGDKVLGLLRTIALSQIDGPSGLLHLREDLTDLLVGGHDSMIQQVLIGSMVVE